MRLRVFSIPESFGMIKLLWAYQGEDAAYVAIGAAKSHGQMAMVLSREKLLRMTSCYCDDWGIQYRYKLLDAENSLEPLPNVRILLYAQ